MKKVSKFYVLLGVVALLVILFFAAGPFYIINEGEQAVVSRLGSIVATRTDAGMYIRIPIVDVVTRFPSKILSLNGDTERIPTKENQFIVVDTTSRWRIADPAQFYRSFKTVESSYPKLSDIIDSATRTVITRNRLSEIVRNSNIINEIQVDAASQLEGLDDDVTKELSALATGGTSNEIVTKGREKLCQEMTEEARKNVAEYGIELIDIVPRQIKYSDELTESVYSRMIKERNQVAQQYRSLGEGRRAEWIGKMENEKRTIESEAYRVSEETKGKADAEAAAIYNEAYSRDPQFYEFWKSLESYKSTMDDFDPTFSTNMDYFKYLYGPNGNR